MRRVHIEHSPMLSLLLPMFLIVVGCAKSDSNRGDIRGEVKLDGQMIEQGSILFVPIEDTQGTATGGNIANGIYQLSGTAAPMIGHYRVEIHALRKTGKKIQKPYSQSGEMIDEQVEAIPPSFNSASTLCVEVKTGDNIANFDVAPK